MKSIYLDNNSTSPIDPRVVEAMARVQRDGLANPASQHHLGRRARRLLEEAREGIASLLGADVTSLRADQLIFTSGGTEANNLALFGLTAAAAAKTHEKQQVIVSGIEHPSILESVKRLEQRGVPVVRLGVSSHGVVDERQLEEALEQPTALASVMLANHETGVLQPIERLAACCSVANVPLHTDAVQAVGKVPVHFRQLGVNAMTLTAHKVHGPLGIGALLLRSDVKLEPTLFGGFQQAGLRPGTEPVALAVGFHEALRLAHDELVERTATITRLADELASTLREAFPDLVVAGEAAPRLPHTLNVAFPGVNRQALLMSLDMAGVACSTGSACASGSSEPSPVLKAMRLPSDAIEGAIRLSLSALTTAGEVAEASRRIIRCVNDLRTAQKPRKSANTPS